MRVSEEAAKLQAAVDMTNYYRGAVKREPYRFDLKLSLQELQSRERLQYANWAKAHDPRFQTERTTT